MEPTSMSRVCRVDSPSFWYLDSIPNNPFNDNQAVHRRRRTVGSSERRPGWYFKSAIDDGVSPRRQEGEGTDGGKISSADSGIETGNDSNDSSVPQLNINFVSDLKKWFDSPVMSNQLALVKSPLQPDMTDRCIQVGLTAQSVPPECTANCIDQPQSSLSSDTMDDSKAVVARNQRALVLRAVQQQYRNRNSFVAPYIKRSYRPVKIYTCTPRMERRMRIAAATNNIEALKTILENGISPNNCDEQGRTPLHFASGRGYAEIVALLLKYGADAKRRDCIGNTPLHLAAVTSKISVVTLLLEAGTDPLSLDDHGYNPLQLANTKLRLLKNCKGDDMMDVKSAVQSVVNMLSAYLRNRDGFGEQVEALSSICSRLTLSNTSDQLQNDVENLLTNIDYLQLNS